MQISEAAQIAALKIYNENVMRATGENLQHYIQDACEEYACNLSDYKAKQLAQKDREIERLREEIEVEKGIRIKYQNLVYAAMLEIDVRLTKPFEDRHICTNQSFIDDLKQALAGVE